MSWYIPKREASKEIIEGLNRVSLEEEDKASQPTGVFQRGKHQVILVQENTAEDTKPFCCYCIRTLKSTHGFSKESETPPSTTSGILFGPGDGKWQTKKKLFQQTVSQIWGEDLTCHDFQAQKNNRWLACHFSWNRCPASLTPTRSSAPLCRNPALQSHKEPGKGHRQAAVPVHRVPSPPWQVPSLTWKGISTAHPLVLLEELFKQTLNEPMPTLSMCLKFEVSCKSGRLTQCHLTISQFTSNQW